MKRPVAFYMLLIMASIFLFFFLNLVLGSVSIPLRAVWNILWGTGNESVIWQNIIWKSRVPQALTALVAGAGLSVSGLQMQTVFRNPLAGPSVLGISSGASMGVAFVVLLSGSLGGVALSKLGFMGEIALTIAAIAGSLSIMALIVFVSQKVRGNVTLLIIGVMIGYIANAVIGVLKFFSVEEDIRAYVIWGLGSFARVSGDQMTLFICIMVVLSPLSFPACQNIESFVAGRCIRTESRIEYKTCPSACHYLFGSIGSYCYRILRSDYFSGAGRSASLQGNVPHIRSSYSDACFFTGRCVIGIGM